MNATERFLALLLATSVACGGAETEPQPEPEAEPTNNEQEDVELPPLEPQLWPGACVAERFEGGTQTTRTTHWYDRQMRPLRNHTERFAEGTAELSSVAHWTYDDDTRTGTVVRFDVGETPHEYDETEFDERGNLVRVHNRGGQYLEPHGTDVYEWRIIDGEERMVREAYYPEGADEPTSDLVYRYDEQDRPAGVYRLSNGQVTESTHYYIDGKRTKTVTVTDGSESSVVYEYTGDLVTRHLIDEGNDRIYEATTDYIYDEHDNIVRVEHDDDADGVIDRTDIYTREYDDNGFEVRTTRDEDNDGVIDGETIRTFHDNGQVKRLELFTDGDSAPNVHEYDEHGNETLWLVSFGPHLEDIELRYNYDCWLDLQPPPEIEIPEVPEPGEAMCMEVEDQWKTACHAGYRVAGEDGTAEAITVEFAAERAELTAAHPIREYTPDGEYFAYQTDANDTLAVRVTVTADENGQPVVEETWGGTGWMRFETTPGVGVTILLEQRFDDMEIVVEGYADGSQSPALTELSVLSDEACGIYFDRRFDFVPQSETTDLFVSLKRLIEDPGGVYSIEPLVFHISQQTGCPGG